VNKNVEREKAIETCKPVKSTENLIYFYLIRRFFKSKEKNFKKIYPKEIISFSTVFYHFLLKKYDFIGIAVNKPRDAGRTSPSACIWRWANMPLFSDFQKLISR